MQRAPISIPLPSATGRSICIMPLQALPESGEQYDLVIVTQYWSGWPTRAAALQTCISLCTPNGALSWRSTTAMRWFYKNLIQRQFASWKKKPSWLAVKRSLDHPQQPLDRRNGLRHWHQRHNCSVTAESGIRVFYDYMPAEFQTRPWRTRN